MLKRQTRDEVARKRRLESKAKFSCMKTIPIEQAVEQANSTKVFTYRGWGGALSRWRPWLAPLQPRPYRKILSSSACTETENYDCVPLKMSAMMNDHAINITTRASERKFFKGYEGWIPGPQILFGPQALLGPMPLNHFLSDECRSSFKSEGITIFACS